MDVTRINLLHKMWCNIQKNDHMMATFERASNITNQAGEDFKGAAGPTHMLLSPPRP
jgi:hypothetical protein